MFGIKRPDLYNKIILQIADKNSIWLENLVYIFDDPGYFIKWISTQIQTIGIFFQDLQIPIYLRYATNIYTNKKILLKKLPWLKFDFVHSANELVLFSPVSPWWII